MSDGHHEIRLAEPVPRPSDRSVGVVTGTLLLALGLFPIVDGGWPSWLALVGVVLLLAAAVRPRLLHPLAVIGNHLGVVLQRIASSVLLTLTFFLVVTPLGWALRVTGRRPLRLDFDRGAGSYWTERSASLESSIERQF